MASKFNLIDEAWISVQRTDGVNDAVGIGELLRNANQYRGLAEIAPPVTFALYRLLLAIVSRAMGQVKNTDTYPTDSIAAYLKKWRDKFWLFDESYPFMQEVALRQDAGEDDKWKEYPWTVLSYAHASGNNAVLYDHSSDGAPTAISYAVAAKLLIAHQQFDSGGLVGILKKYSKKGKTSRQPAPMCNKLIAMPLGNTLAETLLYGAHYSSDRFPNDMPYWEDESGEIILKERHIRGHSDNYTFRPRAILLLDSGDGVRYIKRCEGIVVDYSGDYRDRMVSMRKTQEEKFMPISLRDSSIWRELPALLNPQSDYGAPILTASQWRKKGVRAMSILAGGVKTDKDKVEFWREASYTLPAIIIDSEAKHADFNKLMEDVEKDRKKLYFGHDNKTFGKSVTRAMQNSYLQEMEINFPKMLADIIESDDSDEAWEEIKKRWGKMRLDAMRKALRDAEDAAGNAIREKMEFLNSQGGMLKYIKELKEELQE